MALMGQHTVYHSIPMRFVLLIFTDIFPKLYTHHYTVALPYDNMGVNLAELTMSVFCYPM